MSIKCKMRTETRKGDQTYHSQHPPSHQISKAPIATYAKSSVALPKLLIPCTIPPLPLLPPISAAILTKLSTLRCILPSGVSRRSLPHSHEKMQPLGALAGNGGMGLRTRGSCCVSLRKAPRPLQEEKNWCRKGALMIPMTALPEWITPMETQNMGKR